MLVCLYERRGGSSLESSDGEGAHPADLSRHDGPAFLEGSHRGLMSAVGEQGGEEEGEPTRRAGRILRGSPRPLSLSLWATQRSRVCACVSGGLAR